MKKIVLLFICVSALSARAQDKVTDYFYPHGNITEIYCDLGDNRAFERIQFDSNFNVMTKLTYEYFLGQGYVAMTKDVIVVQYTSNMIWQSLKTTENKVLGTVSSVAPNNKVVLKLPNVGQVEKWTDEYSDNEARLVTINVCIGGENRDINAIEVKTLRYRNGKKWYETISYWAKGYGLILILADNKVFACRRMLNPNVSNPLNDITVEFKKVKYYDVDKRREEELQKEREAQLEKFLQERETRVYDLKEHAETAYLANEKRIFEVVDSIVRKHNATNVRISCMDDVEVKYDGEVIHNIAIGGSERDYNDRIESEIKQAVEALKFAPLRVTEHCTKKNYPVHSQSRYAVDYHVLTDKEDLALKKSRGVELLSGNVDFYNSEKGFINTMLQDKGKYWITETRIDRCGDVSRNFEIKARRCYKNRFFIGYNYAKAAPIGIMLGCTHMNYSKHWGAYVGLKSSTRQTFNAPVHEDISKIERVGYSRFGGVVGGVYSIKKIVNIYLGAGYGRCSSVYSNGNRSLYYKATPVKGIEAEVGVIVKPVRLIGLSVGYDAISNINPDSRNSFYGEFNVGVSIFL